MPGGRKSKVSLQELYDFLYSLKNAAGWSQAPDGKSLTKFLQEHFGYSSPQLIQKKILELGRLGVLEQHLIGRKLFRVKLLKDTWTEPEIPEVKKAEIAEIEPKGELPGKTAVAEISGGQKRFLILIDYRNFEKGFSGYTFEKFSNFNWLIDPLLEEGKIGNIFVFVPLNYINRTPVVTLSHRERTFVVACPRQIAGGITKERDSVDARMESLGKFMIEHSDTTDLVMVGGDGDYQELIVFAKWQQKKVRIVSTKNALSARLREMGSSSRVEIREVV